MNINEMAQAQHDWVERMGWHNKTNLEALALILSEIGEAANECRGETPTDNFGEELADIVLRTMDLAMGSYLDLGESVGHVLPREIIDAGCTCGVMDYWGCGLGELVESLGNSPASLRFSFNVLDDVALSPLARLALVGADIAVLAGSCKFGADVSVCVVGDRLGMVIVRVCRIAYLSKIDLEAACLAKMAKNEAGGKKPGRVK